MYDSSYQDSAVGWHNRSDTVVNRQFVDPDDLQMDDVSLMRIRIAQLEAANFALSAAAVRSHENLDFSGDQRTCRAVETREAGSGDHVCGVARRLETNLSFSGSQCLGVGGAFRSSSLCGAHQPTLTTESEGRCVSGENRLVMSGQGQHTCALDSDHQSNPPAQMTMMNHEPRSTSNSLRLDKFDGSTAVEPFISKFETFSSYFRWGSRERSFHIRISLAGAAAEILSQIDANASVEEILSLLKQRFGSENQQQRYRRELRSRRRRNGETIQDLSNDLLRIASHAYPTSMSASQTSLLNDILKEAFFDALNDSSLAARVFDQMPSTFADAVNLATYIESHSSSKSQTVSPVVHASVPSVPVVATAVTVPCTVSSMDTLLASQVVELKNKLMLAENNAELKSREANFWRTIGAPPVPPPVLMAPPPVFAAPAIQPFSMQPPMQPPQSFAQPSAHASSWGNRLPSWQRGTGTYQGARGPRPSVPRGGCLICSGPHWRSQCPSLSGGGTAGVGGVSVQSGGQPTTATSKIGEQLSVQSNAIRDAYIQAFVKGKKVKFLLDSGAQVNLIAKHKIGKVKPMPSSTKLFTASKQVIPNLGSVVLPLNIQGLIVSTQFYVTDTIEDAILGFPFLWNHDCTWRFKRGLFYIGDKVIPLFSNTHSAGLIRRVYCSSETVIPPNTCAHIPVRLTVKSISHELDDHWLLEAKTLRDNLHAPNVLLDSKFAASIPVINFSDKPCIIRRDVYISNAVQVDAVHELPNKDSMCDKLNSDKVDSNHCTDTSNIAEHFVPELFHDTQLTLSETSCATASYTPIVHHDSMSVATLEKVHLLSDTETVIAQPAIEVIDLTESESEHVLECNTASHTDRDRDTITLTDSYGISSSTQPVISTVIQSGSDVMCSPTFDSIHDGARLTGGTGNAPLTASYDNSAASYPDRAYRPETLPNPSDSLVFYDEHYSQNSTTSTDAFFIRSIRRDSPDCFYSTDSYEHRLHQNLTVSAGQTMGESYEHLQTIFDDLPTELSDEQVSIVKSLLCKYSSTFSKHDLDVGCTSLLTANIDTGNAPPVYQTLRRHPIAHLNQIDDLVDDLAKNNVISPCISPWAANVVLVARKGGAKTRLCIDYRALNKVTIADLFPVPSIASCFDSLGNNLYYSTLDLSSSFYQIKLDSKDALKTAFVTRKGQFCFNRVSMGLKNGSALLARVMQLALNGVNLLNAVCYLDDITIFGTSFEHHMANFEIVLQRLQWANLKIKPSKCQLLRKRISFLGHIVSQDGLEADPAKIAVIKAWKFPRNAKELKSFLGIAGYYRHFCPFYSRLSAPLTAMLKKGARVTCTPEASEAFHELKSLLTNPPVLALYREHGDLILDTDSSDFAAGAVLSQWQDGKLRVLEYASKTYSPAERMQCSNRRELLALVFGLRQFRHYLLARKFLVRVDNAAVTYYKNANIEAVGQLARHLDFLSQFDYTIEHRAGKSHGNCDGLSRAPPCDFEAGLPCKKCTFRTVEHFTSTISAVVTRRQAAAAADVDPHDILAPNDPALALSPPGIVDQQTESKKVKKSRNVNFGDRIPDPPAGLGLLTPESIAELQQKDPDVASVRSWVQDGIKPDWNSVKGLSPTIRAYYAQFDSLVMHNGLLCRVFIQATGKPKYFQIIVPVALRSHFLEAVHSDITAHLKFNKSADQLKKRAYWHLWKRDLKLFILACNKCAAYLRGNPPKQAFLRPNQVGGICEKWSIDLMGPFTGSNGFHYIFTAVDMFSKYLVCAPLRNKDAESVARCVVDNIILTYGMCTTLMSDRGTEFTADLAQSLYRILRIDHIKVCAYTPTSNGSAERVHRTLNSMLAKCISDTQTNWSYYLRYLTFVYNATEHSSTSFSPYFLMFGRDPFWRLDLCAHTLEQDHANVSDYAKQTVERIDYAHQLAREHLGASASSQSDYFNKSAHPVSFEIGAKVRWFYPRRVRGRSPKWQNFSSNTATVLRRINDATYLIRLDKSNKVVPTHVNKLKSIVEFN